MFATALSLPFFLASVIGGVSLYYFLAFQFRREKSSLPIPIPMPQWSELEQMPRELQTSTLVMNEQSVSVSKPVPLHGKIDQLFKTQNGYFILVDTKSREVDAVYSSDIIQLSVYRAILSQKYGSAVSMYAYVRIVRGRFKPKITYRRVRLLGGEAIIHLWREHNDIREGLFKPDCTCGGHLHN